MQHSIIPNAAKLIESLRYLTYTNEAAIADIVDNSFDAMAENVNIYIKRDDCILISDDGYGMDKETLTEAIKLGSDTQKEQSDLGRFGMGLVTAGISMGRRIEVMSKVAGGEPHKIALDLDLIGESNKWIAEECELTTQEEEAFKNIKSGTCVSICKLDSVKSNVGTAVANHLRRVFREFLATGRTITVNGEELTPIDPLARDLDDTKILLDEDIEVGGGRVHITAAHINHSKSDMADKYNDENHIPINSRTQGFYIMRNNREIASGTTLDLYLRHPGSNRFRCEISYSGDLDKEFGINFMKRDVNTNQSLRDKIAAKVLPLISMVQAQAKHREQVSAAEKIDHNDAEQIIKNKKGLLRTDLKWKEKREPREKDGTPRPDPKKKIEREHIKRIQPGNKAMPAEIREADLGKFSPLFDCFFEGSKIVIRWNIQHPFHAKVIAKYSDDKNIVTPIDFLVYSLAQEILSSEIEERDKKEERRSISDSIVSMSENLRILMQ